MPEPFPFGQMPDQPQPKQLSPKEKRGCFIIILIAVIGFILLRKLMSIAWVNLMLFSALMLFCGVLEARKTSKKPKPDWRYTVLCFAIGIIFAAGSILTLLSDVFGMDLMPSDKSGGRTNYIFMIAIGVGIIVFCVTGYIHKKRCCTMLVDAVCIDIQKSHRVRGMMQTPIYEIYYGGVPYHVADRIGSDAALPHVGESRQLYVDPDDLNEVFDPKRYLRMLVLPCVIGLCVIAAGVYVMLR